MVFFIYTGTYKSFEAFLRTITDLNDQYEISIFISTQNGDIDLAKKYMKEQNFLIWMIEAILGWMKSFPQIWPAWVTILEKLSGISYRNELILQKNWEMQDVYNQNTQDWKEDITRPNDNQLPDYPWARREWGEYFLPDRQWGERRWQKRPPPGSGRYWDGAFYPPGHPPPLPQPGRGDDLGGGGIPPGERPRDQWRQPGDLPRQWREPDGGGNMPPPPPDDWGNDEGPGDWWYPQPPSDDNRPPPDGGGGLPPPPEEWEWWDWQKPPDPRRRCGY